MGKTNTIGILSIVFAIILAPVGFILGIIGIIKNNKNKESIVLPLIGLILSLVFFPLFIIGIIAYVGVLDPSGLIPEGCTSKYGINCAMEDIGDDFVIINIVNVLGRPIEIQDIRMESCEEALIENMQLNNRDNTRIVLSDCQKTRSIHRIDAQILYQYTDLPENSRINLTSDLFISG